MIHPINLPEELYAANPTRPSLIELRRKPKITYGPDGRRMRDGMPTSPKSPNTLWESTFIRGFVHRMAYDVVKSEVDSVETSSVSSLESLIDIVDFQPSSRHGLCQSATDRPQVESDDLIQPLFAFDSRTTEGPTDEEDEGQGIFRRSSSKQFAKSSPSAIIDPEIIGPILTPCCSSEELMTKHNCISTIPSTASSTPPPTKYLREFLRFDFSNSADVFKKSAQISTFRPLTSPPPKKSTNSKRPPESHFLPNPVGSRIWFNKSLNKSFGKHDCQQYDTSMTPINQKPRLVFSVDTIDVTNKLLRMKITAKNSAPVKITVETSVHLHKARGSDVNDKIYSQDQIFGFSANRRQHLMDFCVDLSHVDVTLLADEYIVVTILGHIACC